MSVAYPRWENFVNERLMTLTFQNVREVRTQKYQTKHGYSLKAGLEKVRGVL